jgi:hypothetical protein
METGFLKFFNLLFNEINIVTYFRTYYYLIIAFDSIILNV